MHRYDVYDHNELNPEVGARAEFDALVAELHPHGVRSVSDLVHARAFQKPGLKRIRKRAWKRAWKRGWVQPCAWLFAMYVCKPK